MLKLLIAEDDIETRNGLCECVQWSDFDIELIKAVSNGKEALDFLEAEECELDILITDVKMPLMDGVQLVSHIRNMGYKTKAIIITAFWEKEYVKAAFEYDVVDYILKPINLEELGKVLVKACGECFAEKALQERNVRLEQSLTESMEALRERLLEHLLLGHIEDVTYIKNRLVFAEFPFRFNDWFTVLCVDVFFQLERNNVLVKEEKIRSIEKDIRQNLQGLFEYYSFWMGNRYVILLSAATCMGYDKQWVASVIIKQKLFHIAGKEINVGLSNEVNGIDKIYISYQEAIRAIEYCIFYDSNSITHYRDINQTLVVQDYETKRLQDKIIQQVHLGNMRQSHSYLEELFTHFQSKVKVNMEYIQNVCLEIVIDINKYIQSVIANSKLIDESIDWKDLYRLSSIDTLKDWMHSTIDKIFHTIQETNNNSYTNSIRRIIDIIANSYMEEITIQMIADQVFMTPNYLSLLFKKQTGQTMNEYITKVRMEKAMELLRDPTIRIFEVSQLVGYKNSDYFTKIFKRYTGIKPFEYKERSIQ